ncbi:MAG TPA: hypothetical protein VH157_15610 [Bryobacteraceae bacterium]|nr:hypothetical protein [Bryobacteraceae bacterium]
MRKAVLLVLLSGVLVSAQPEKPAYFLEREPVNGGAELVTLFGHLSDPGAGSQKLEVPLVSVLRDTLGDADSNNDRLRYVWILTSTRPTPVQRVASATSVIWFRAGTRKHDNRVPAPAMDLASPATSVWTNLLGDSLQAYQFDPLGMAVRASTRGYRENFSDYHKLQLFGALGALDGLERAETGDSLLSDSDFRQLYSRLSLSDRTLGGLVREQNLSKFYDRETARIQETRGHNWELLRQRAELCGLYFEPLALPGDTPLGALLWVAEEDLDRRSDHSFDRQFLNIADPWTDKRLEHWTGYTETRYLDNENRAVSADTPGARAVEMIPLAFYSLDHPRVPLLLADFRDQLKPKRREMVQHGSSVLITGILGLTRFGNWPFFAGESAWMFVRGRHGAAVNRSARMRSYSEARTFLAVDTLLDPKLKAELLTRLDHLALNPLENGAAREAQLAREQYQALVQYAQTPGGLEAKLELDRRKELASYRQSGARRILATIGRFFSPGPRIESEMPEPVLIAEIDAHRRALHHQRYLEQLLASSPRPEVVGNIDEILRSVEALSAESDARLRSPLLIAKVFARSGDSDLRLACLRALQHFNLEEARNELRRLSQDPATGDGWRELCRLYLSADPGPVLGAASGGQ